MKSRISFFDRTVFKKDLSRFAPVWILYSLCLFIGMLMLWQDGTTGNIGFHRNIAYLLPVMSVINFCYAPLNAQLLFGDLYSSRLCNAIHAFPVRRETLFATHALSGIGFSLVPTLAGAVFALVLGIGSPVESGWQLPLLWLLGTNLQYLFFFGAAVFCALCAGNRFSQAVLYGILNFLSILVFWLVDSLYTPLLYGLQTKQDGFILASPVCQMSQLEFMRVSSTRHETTREILRAWYTTDGSSWGYLAACALIGAALLVCACLLYRRRQLECAGDFLAVRALEPVFMAIFPLISAAAFYLFGDEMIYTGIGTALFLLIVGFVVGFFLARMLLERTVRIFRVKNFLGLAVLAVCFGLTLFVTRLDPLGLVTWTPDADQVAEVSVWPNHYGNYDTVTLSDPADIENILRVHDYALEHREHDSEGESIYTLDQQVSLHYTLKNGQTRSRYYYVDLEAVPGDILIPYFSSFRALFPNLEDPTPASVAAQTSYAVVGDGWGEETAFSDPVLIRQLLDAVEQDCRAGTMVQHHNYRPKYDYTCAFWVNFVDQYGMNNQIQIFSDCEASLNWLLDQGYTSHDLELFLEEQSSVKKLP